MSTDNPLPLALEAAASIDQAIANAFREIWERPDVTDIVLKFLDDDLYFMVDKAGITILAREQESTDELSDK